MGKVEREIEQDKLEQDMRCPSSDFIMGNRKHEGISYVTDSRIKNKISGGTVRKILAAQSPRDVFSAVFKNERDYPGDEGRATPTRHQR